MYNRDPMQPKLAISYIVMFFLGAFSYGILTAQGIEISSPTALLPTLDYDVLNLEIEVTKLLIDTTKYILAYIF